MEIVRVYDALWPATNFSIIVPMRQPAGFIVLSAWIGLFGCTQRWPENVVAKVDGKPITVEEVQAAWTKFPHQDAHQSPPWERSFILQRLIEQKVLASEAKKEGFTIRGSQPQTTSLYSEDELLALTYRHKLERDFQPLGSDIQSYYEAHHDYYQEPLESGHEIIVPTSEQARSIEGLLKGGMTFKDAAWLGRGYVGQSKFDLSVIPPFRKGDRSPDFERAFFRLSPGQTSNVVILGTSYYILKRGQPRTKVPAWEIQQEIRQLLTQKAVMKKIEELVAAANVRIEQDKLAQLSFNQ